MNTNSIKKHYGKLTDRERFAALFAAEMREDKDEILALVSSSPKKTWKVATVRGLGDAFEWLAVCHMNSVLAYTANFYFMLFGIHEDGDIDSDIDETFLLQARILAGCAAWRAVCKEYGIDANEMRGAAHGVKMLDMTENAVMSFYGDHPPELAELQAVIDSYKAVIETKRAEWE